MPWITALKSTARSGFTLQRAYNEPLRALRGAVGAGIAAFGALLLGNPQLAASAAIGAFIAGVATFQRSYRPRPLLALAAAAGLSLSTFVGYLASPWAPLFVLVVGLWAFMGGLAWSLGQAAGVVATNTIPAMLVVVALTENIPQALAHAGVIAAGGLVQALLVVVWPIRRWGAQRDALADAYASMADYARRLRHDPFAAFDPDPLMVARSAATVTRRQARTRPPELAGRRGTMERMRPAMAALADPRVGADEEGPERDRAREILGAAAQVLDAVAHSIRTGRPVAVPERTYRALALRSTGPVLTGAARQSALLLIGLLADTADSLESPGGDGDGSSLGTLSRPSVHELLPVAVHAVRRNWHWSSPVLRHAVRVGVVAAVGETIGMLLPFGHGYWAPLTAVMVMRPDFSQTYSRGVGRIVGTALGVVLASLVIWSAAPGDRLLTGLAVVAIGGAYLTILTGYAAMSACVAAYVVFLLAMDGSGLVSTAEERVGQTLLGGALALIAYALFPTWQTVRLPDRLAAYVEAGGHYAAAAVAAFGAPSADSYRAVREALLDHRQARAELLTATGQAADEPVRHRGLRNSQISGARSAMAALGRTTLLMEAHLPPLDADPGSPRAPVPVPGAERFAAVLRQETARAAGSVRLEQPIDLTPVRLEYQAWAAELPDPDEESTDPRHLVVRDAGLLVAALEGLQQALGFQPSGERPPGPPRK
ncbi:FUSC family protein [Streptacidiphilus carbonis]|uniref:FUSC family protein n=1 Tax=Streptacidiphilus carbonis TaxID=105422 RepID=UPI0005A92E97|nr:FUSC family protein [Streptacidiphilus carbonis]